jgi:acid phosphatase family membrane protein YuiD
MKTIRTFNQFLNESVNESSHSITPELKALTGKKVKSVSPGEVGGILITFTDGTELEYSNNMIALKTDGKSWDMFVG